MKRIYIDMDGVLCDFQGAFDQSKKAQPDNPYPQSVANFYTSLEPIAGALAAMELLGNSNEYETFILTAPSTYNPLSYTEKRIWVEEHLGFPWVEKLIISPDKSLLKGDILIDDNDNGKGQENFEGELIHFGSAPFLSWKKVLAHLEI